MLKPWEVIQKYSAKILGEEATGKLLTNLKKCWNGEEVLWRVFWLYGVAVSVVLSLFVIAPVSATGGRLAESIALLVVLPYVVWVLKSVWACALNCSEEGFKGVPQKYVVLATKVVVVWAGINYFLALFG